MVDVIIPELLIRILEAKEYMLEVLLQELLEHIVDPKILQQTHVYHLSFNL